MANQTRTRNPPRKTYMDDHTPPSLPHLSPRVKRLKGGLSLITQHAEQLRLDGLNLAHLLAVTAIHGAAIGNYSDADLVSN